MLKAALVGLVLSVSGFANAGLITTTFNDDNSFAGNMFNVTTFNNSLLLTGADINLDDIGSNALISVYSRVGGYVGFENNASDWLLQGQTTVNSNGAGVGTFFDFNDFTLNANTLYGLYFTVSDYATSAVSMLYTDGNNSYANSDLQLDLGIGRGNDDFIGKIFTPRTWNGTLHYSSVDVPEPSTLVIFALGIMGLVARRSLLVNKK